MGAAAGRELSIAVGDQQVSAILDLPKSPRATFIFAHSAGAGMRHPFMQSVADGLAVRRIAALRYQFPYMESGSKRPDRPAVAHAAVRAAVNAAGSAVSDTPLIAGGKSFGGRMTSQTQAETPLPGVVGLAFLGFPLHPVGKPSDERADHLFSVKLPMLFLQGTRDELAELNLLRGVCKRLGGRAQLELVEGGDHSFKVPAKALAETGRKAGDVMNALLDRFAAWANSIV